MSSECVKIITKNLPDLSTKEATEIVAALVKKVEHDKKIGQAGMIVAIPNVTLASGNLYIAFNKNTDDKIIQKWQDAFNKLLKNGTIKRIKARY